MSEWDQILKDRAELLAAQPASEHLGEMLELVSFAVAGERYALSVDEIREIQPISEVTPIPCVPRFVRGLMNLRGGLLTVIDLHEFLSIRRPGMRDASRVIVLASDDLEVGLAVREVFDLVRVAAGGVLPPLVAPGGIDGKFLRGMLPDLTLVLNANALLGDPKMVIDDSRGGHARAPQPAGGGA
ncbi:MAG: purine-binding chemotaxis protein CheW [Candidatus Riflebacteria bacterium]|nr:purine-binding chemotaxis protein CheW [Candidatus Riflebacteria bacterium]